MAAIKSQTLIPQANLQACSSIKQTSQQAADAKGDSPMLQQFQCVTAAAHCGRCSHYHMPHLGCPVCPTSLSQKHAVVTTTDRPMLSALTFLCNNLSAQQAAPFNDPARLRPLHFCHEILQHSSACYQQWQHVRLAYGARAPNSQTTVY